MNQRTGDESSGLRVRQPDVVMTWQHQDCIPVRVRISEPGLLGDLSDALSRASCHVERFGEDGIEVGPPSPLLTPEQARKEIALYLVLWRVKHPDVQLTVEQ